VLAEALAWVEQTEERFWEAEIYRLTGALLLKAEGAGRSRNVVEGMQDAGSPEGCFLKAIEIARRQEGKSLELRATVSLAQLWQQQGKKNQARHSRFAPGKSAAPRAFSRGYGCLTANYSTEIFSCGRCRAGSEPARHRPIHA